MTFQDNQNHEFPEIPADRYRILQNIGKGAFSRVFLAYTAEFQRRAVKRIRLTAKPHMLLKEIEFLRRLEGKSNIVQLKEIRFSDRTYQTTVITNYLDSDDFKSIILDFTPLDIQKYMKSLLQALAHLENAPDPSNNQIRGILHRDVKPGNFLFERSTGKGLLIDFGLAQSLKEAREFPLMRLSKRQAYQFPSPYQRKYPIAQPIDRNQSSRSLPTQPHSGTHGYRAPEILVPVANQSPKIDTWSAGVIMLQIITGKTSIFRGNPNTDVYELLAIRSIIGTDRFVQQMSSLGADFQTPAIAMPQNISLEELCEYYNPDLLAVLPAQGFEFCRKLLEFDPKNRLSASQALQHPFLQLKNLPDFRYQDGCCSKSVMSITGENEEQAALKKRSQALAESLGLCKSTAETLAEEYSKMILSQMIPLPKDVRKAIENAVKQFGADQSEVIEIRDEVNGKNFEYVIQRGRTQDFQYPSTSSVQELSSCIPTQITKPRMSSAPNFLINLEETYQKYEEEAKKQETELLQNEEFQKMSDQQKDHKLKQFKETLKQKIFQQQFEAANQEKEAFERAVRCTAFRRRVDPWIQPLKALDKELRIAQNKVRHEAEEYRRSLIEKGILQLENPEQQQQQANQQQNQTKKAKQTEYDIITQNNGKSKLQLKSKIKAVFNMKYPKDYTLSEVQSNRLTSYFLANIFDQQSSQQLIANAWDQVTKNALNYESTNPSIMQLNKLYRQAAELATTSHRIALNGPAGWNCQGYQYYQKDFSQQDLAQIQGNQDMAGRIRQFQRTFLLYESEKADIQEEIVSLKEKIADLLQNKQKILAKIDLEQTLLSNNKYDQKQAKQRIAIYQQDQKVLEAQIQAFSQRSSQYEARLKELADLQKQEQKECQEFEQCYEKTIPKTQTEIQSECDNESNLWSETLTISDDFSEIKPTNGPAPDKLQEPYFASAEEIKKLFQLKDNQAQARKNRRQKVRRFERVYAKFADPAVDELERIQKAIFEERQKLQAQKASDETKVVKMHAEMLPRQQQGALAKASAAAQFRTTSEVIEKQSCSCTNLPQKIPVKAQINQMLHVESQQNAIYNLFSSPLGRFYIAFFRLIGDRSDELTGRDLLLQYFKKAEISIPTRVLCLQNQLQQLIAAYAKTSVGKSDLILAAAATQSELDLRADGAVGEKADLGLSKRSPNMEYLLQVFGKLQPIIRTQEASSRSTSSITGLQKSATHRSLIDPGRTQQRYPQTSKYIQTMLEQTLKRYATLPGILESVEKEMVQSITSVKARIFESQVNRLYNSTVNNKEKIQLGRIRDGMKEIGVDAIYEILRGRGFPRSVLQEKKSCRGFQDSVIADDERRRLLLSSKYGGAKLRRRLQ